MQVFISWSGERSKMLANMVRHWMATVVPESRPWSSDVDINPPKSWFNEIVHRLAESGFGIACFTPENVRSPWLLFEAGALARSNCLLPLLFDLTPKDLPEPVLQFQTLQVSKEHMMKLALKVNKLCCQSSTSHEDLEHRFKIAWPWFENQLSLIPENPIPLLEDPIRESAVSDDGPLTVGSEQSGAPDSGNLVEVLERELAAAEASMKGHEGMIKFYSERSAGTLPVKEIEEQYMVLRYRRKVLFDALSIIRRLENSQYGEKDESS